MRCECDLNRILMFGSWFRNAACRGVRPVADLPAANGFATTIGGRIARANPERGGEDSGAEMSVWSRASKPAE